MHVKSLFAIVSIASLAGCATGPTPHQQNSAYYGDPIGQEDAEAAVKASAGAFLKDPMSAIYDCKLGGKGWLGSSMAWGGVDVYGWALLCDINGKNSFGAYAGAQRYMFIFTDGRLRRGAIVGGGVMQIVLNNP